MNFDVDKYSVMHIGLNDMQGNYNMSNQQLTTTNQQRDLGIIICLLHQRPQVIKTNREKLQSGQLSTGFIVCNLRYKNKELILPLYKFLLRQRLEHAVQFWSPHLRRDSDKIEKKRYREKQQKWCLKSETTAATSESRILISSALYKGDCEDN